MSKPHEAKQSRLPSDLRVSETTVLNTHGYKISNSLGAGGYGKVYVGEFLSKRNASTKLLACKVIDTAVAGETYVKKFLPRELAILLKVSHPHIIQLHSIFTNAHKIFIFMRYAENGDLSQYLVKNGPVAEDQGRIWARQLALALQYLHILDVAHRDIKCKNVLITYRMNVKLCDFGFARIMLNDTGDYIMSKSYCGTITYLAPEVLHHNEYDAKRADMWSMGVLIFKMLNNTLPFRGTKPKVLLKNQLEKDWKFSSRVRDKLSENLKLAITGLLEPDVEQRWTAEQFVRCDWIAMDSELTMMDIKEYNAFMQATEEMKVKKVSNPNPPQRVRSSIRNARRISIPQTPGFTLFRQDSSAFRMTTLQSEIDFVRRKLGRTAAA